MPGLATPTLTDEALVEMLSLIKGAGSVELKLTIPESSQRSTVLALGMDPLGAQVRLVHFFDTPDLQLESAGVVVRGRRVAGKGDDSVVKLRPVVPSELPRKVRESRVVHGRGRRDARRLRLLGLDEGHAGHGRAGRRGRVRAAAQAVLQGAARLLRRPRPRGDRVRGPLAPGPDLRPQAQGHAAGLRAQDGRRAVAVSRRDADPRALDEVRAPTRPSRSLPRVAPSWPSATSSSAARRRPRRARRSSSSPSSSHATG